MRRFIALLSTSLLFINAMTAQSETQETGFDGDHFSLEGALELFKQSEDLEDFEKRLNEEKDYVNNLDLNKDEAIDYIRVEDKMDGKVHAIILQVPVSETESQDIAVIEIEETGKETALLQIVGDENLYGEQKIVEPFEVTTDASSKGGPSADYEFSRVVVNVYFWRPVRVIYAPRYRPWVSPFRWNAYPRGWTPWRPHAFAYVHRNRVAYHRSYRVVRTHRVVSARRVYTPYRRSSVTVRKRTTVVRTNRANGTTVTRRTTTTRVNKKNGKAVGTKRTTTRVRKNNQKAATRKKSSRTRRAGGN